MLDKWTVEKAAVSIVYKVGGCAWLRYRINQTIHQPEALSFTKYFHIFSGFSLPLQ